MKIEQYIIVKGKKRATYSNYRNYTSRMTKNKPAVEHDEVAVKVSLEIPDAMFEKPTLQADIKVPDEAVSQPTITAEVKDNVEKIILQQTGFNVNLQLISEEEEV